MNRKWNLVLCFVFLLAVCVAFCGCDDPKTTIDNIETRCEEAGLYIRSVKASDIRLDENKGFSSALLASDNASVNILIIKFKNAVFAKENYPYFNTNNSSTYFGLDNSKLVDKWIVCYSDEAQDIVRL